MNSQLRLLTITFVIRGVEEEIRLANVTLKSALCVASDTVVSTS